MFFSFFCSFAPLLLYQLLILSYLSSFPVALANLSITVDKNVRLGKFCQFKDFGPPDQIIAQ